MKVKILFLYLVNTLIICLFFNNIASAQNYYSSYDSFFSGFCAVALIALIISVVLVFWTYDDAKKRNADATLWAVIVFFLGIIGLIIWLIVRPPIGGVLLQSGKPDRICPDCGKEIPFDAILCPYCGRKF